MSRFTKILSSVSLAVVLSLSLSSVVNAASFWKADISTPSTQASRSFNVQYTTLSTEASDAIKVDLYQNGAMVGTQTTVKPYGDSGAFAVTVPSEGVYSYYIVATNGADSQTTATKQVTVSAPPTQITTTVVTNPNLVASGSSNTASGSVAGSSNSGSATNIGSETNGQVNAAGDSTKDNKPSTLGESKTDDKKNDKPADTNNSKLAWSIIGGAVLATILYAKRDLIYKSKK